MSAAVDTTPGGERNPSISEANGGISSSNLLVNRMSARRQKHEYYEVVVSGRQMDGKIEVKDIASHVGTYCEEEEEEAEDESPMRSFNGSGKSSRRRRLSIARQSRSDGGEVDGRSGTGGGGEAVAVRSFFPRARDQCSWCMMHGTHAYTYHAR